MMLRKWVMLFACAAGSVACLAAVTSVADDEEKTTKKAPVSDKEKSPLQKIMVKMDDQMKAIQASTSSAARFRKSGQGKSIIPAVVDLVKLGKDTKPFTEPAETQKKTQQKWVEYTDQYIAASQKLGTIAKKKDFQEIRKSIKELDLSCSNCHGMFRPKTGGDDFGNP